MFKTLASGICSIAISVTLTAQSFSAPVPMESMTAAGGNCGDYTSHLIVNGKPAVAYSNATHGDLMFMRALDAAGTAWSTPVIADSRNNVGSVCSMELVHGYPAIAYLDADYDRLMYVRALDSNGTAWGNPVILEDVANQLPWYITLKMINGNPAVAFAEINNWDVKFIRASDNLGASWGTSVTIAATGQVGADVKLIVVNANPAVVYNNQTNGSIYFSRANDMNGTTWGTPIVISAVGDDGYEMGCSFTAGKPAVSYYNQANGTLKFVVANDVNGTSWLTPITLDNSASVGRYTSMCSSNGNLMISYQDMTNSRIKFIRCLDTIGTTWSTPVPITANNISGPGISLQIVNGNPAISFSYWGIPIVLGYCRAIDASGNTWNTLQTFSTPNAGGNHLSMAVVDGRPAVASTRPALGGKLIYSIATDSTGQSWNSSVEIINTQNGGAYTSLAVMNGNPAIAYTASGVNKVNYIRALDNVGSAWSTPTRVDSTSIAQDCELLNVNGRPAIGYFDASTQQIRFSCALNTNGTTWNPAVIPSGTITAQYFDMEVVNGKPAIAFVNSARTAVYYAIAVDSFGQTWSPAILVDTCSGPYQSAPSLSVVAGNPAVAYEDPISFMLAFRRATDNAGSSWGPMITPSTTALWGLESHLVVHDGRPTISFLGNWYEHLFIAANDSLGNSWSTEVLVDSAYSSLLSFAASTISLNGNIGTGYYRPSDKYGYYSSACIPPLNPTVTTPSAICSGNSVVMSTSGYGTISWYSSSTSGTFLGTGSTFTTGTLTSTTTFYVQDSTCGASTRTAVTVMVNPLPTLTVSGNTTICLGDTTQLTASGNGFSYLWSTGNTTTTELFSPASSLPASVTSTNAVNGCTATLSFTITVVQPVTTTQSVSICANDSYTIGSNTYTTSGTYSDTLSNVSGCDSIVITNLSVQTQIDTTVIYISGMLKSMETGAVYQWIDCQTMQPISGATSQTFTPTVNGTYAAIVTNGACTDTSSCYSVTDVSVSQLTDPAISLASSFTPATGQINGIVNGTTGAVAIYVYNASGQLIGEVSTTGGIIFSVPVNVSGIYLVKASVDGQEIVQRVIVTR